MIANRELLETADLISAFPPVDMQTGANNGLWVSLKDFHRCLIVLFKGVSAANDVPVFTLLQATDNAGTGSKALNFTRVRTKLATLLDQTHGTLMTVITQAAANTFSMTSAQAAMQGFVAVDVKAEDLDVTNGFVYIQGSVPDIGTNAQLGGMLYLPYDSRHPQAVIANALA